MISVFACSQRFVIYGNVKFLRGPTGMVGSQSVPLQGSDMPQG